MRLFLSTLAWLPAITSGCQKQQNNATVTSKDPITVTVSGLAEASGIADSKANSAALWVIEDGGNPAQLILLGHDGKVQQKISIQDAANRDWEDVVLAGDQVYIGDIGDNNQVHTTYTIYRLQEPTAAAVVAAAETIRFRYPDGSHDAEAFFVDPQTSDLYIITKRDAASMVFRLSYPYSVTDINEAEHVATLSITGAVSAALSPDGRQVLVKTYDKIYRYTRSGNETLVTALQHTPEEAAYVREPQGEALCFKLDQSGYFTLSEQLLGSQVKLYFYPK